MRFITQKILTGEFGEWDLPIKNASISFSLSGPTVISGFLEPEIADPRKPELDAWANWIHFEDAGEIRASGILQPMEFNNESIVLEAQGASGYPHGIPYLGEFNLGSPIGVNIDPLDIVRNIWNHVQSYPEGNLGVTVDSTTSPIRIGTEERDVEFETSGGEEVEFTAGPYKLDWWDNVDCGGEINTLSTETPFDFVDNSYWDEGKTDVLHRMRLGYPRIGRKQKGLRFCQGENILSIVPIHESDSMFASQVVVRGRGEGRTSIRGYAGQRIGDRIRRVHMLDARGSVASTSRANAIARDELNRRQALFTVGEIDVDAKHSNAPIGSFGVGDDIFIQAEIPWFGDVYMWHRVMTMSWMPEEDILRLDLARSDTFHYGVIS